jgi:hypothetical protein
MDTHVKVIAILAILFGLLWVVLGIGVFAIVTGAGVASGEREAMIVTGAVGIAIGALLLVIGLPSILAGIGLLNGKGWARILMLIVAALSLVNFPFGTAFAIYAFWVLLDDRTKPLFV